MLIRSSRCLLYAFFLIFIGASCSSDEQIPLDPNREVFWEDVAYGEDERQVMDVLLPANRNRQSTKILIWIHSGGWINGDKREFEAQRDWLKLQLPDYAMIAFNYRLFDFNTNANRFPTQENDIREAVDFVLSKSDEWNISGDMVLAGASSGGHLALLQAYKHNQAKRIKGAIAYFPPSNLEALFTYNSFTALGLATILGGTPDQVPDLYQRSSPFHFVGSDSPPTLLLHGSEDLVVPVSQSISLQEKLIQEQVMHEAYIIEGQGHGFDEEVLIESLDTVIQFIQSNVP
ncbi:alpha/beta hydrolase [Pararhodonellum marinum]|uniref:alpha/beta hydrolase n=1 Tax=Pararhodonellum marinum TaxID=2755358 RepID=UPI00188F8454|nr:alpha/beta hydrolase [Pararhodonellum marinum]